MLRQSLVENLKDYNYRRAFVSAQVRRAVAAQIRELRCAEDRNWTQSELGLRAGMKANAITRLESPDYGDFSVKTLLRLSDAFDLGLIVRFAAFSEIVDWNQNISTTAYIPPSFQRDRRLFFVPRGSVGMQSFYRRSLSKTEKLSISTTNIQLFNDDSIGKKTEDTLWRNENLSLAVGTWQQQIDQVLH